MEDVRAGVEALEGSISSRARKAGERAATTVAIDEAIERSVNTVREPHGTHATPLGRRHTHAAAHAGAYAGQHLKNRGIEKHRGLTAGLPSTLLL